ncbi:MAG: FkbM family methyltransferase [Nitrososphaerota archaeon]|nr:FkbM family methyltransferase [Nitrososphaerota archaeon]
MLKFVPSNGVIVDIGANVGVFSILAASRFGSARVHSFEPSPKNFEMLKRNVALNHMDSVVSTYRLCVAGASGSRVLNLSEEMVANSLYEVHKKRGETTVRCITLREVLELTGAPKIDFAKIDCEGAEVEILMGASRETLQRVRHLTIESTETNCTIIMSLLKSNGFSVESSLADSRQNLKYLYASNEDERYPEQ